MVVRRQDAWTPDDDLMLAEVTSGRTARRKYTVGRLLKWLEKLSKHRPHVDFVGTARFAKV